MRCMTWQATSVVPYHTVEAALAPCQVRLLPIDLGGVGATAVTGPAGAAAAAMAALARQGLPAIANARHVIQCHLTQ
jgi:hypothetical protein